MIDFSSNKPNLNDVLESDNVVRNNYLFLYKSKNSKINDAFAILTILLLTITWTVILSNSCINKQLLPWLILLTFVDIICVYQLFKIFYSTNYVLKQKYIGYRYHSVAIAYFCLTFCFMLLIGFINYAKLNHKNMITQVIDIELTDVNDFQNNNDIIGSTSNKANEKTIIGNKSSNSSHSPIIKPKLKVSKFMVKLNSLNKFSQAVNKQVKLSDKLIKPITSPSIKKYTVNNTNQLMLRTQPLTVSSSKLKTAKSQNYENQLLSENVSAVKKMPVVASWDSIKNQKFINQPLTHYSLKNDTNLLTEVQSPELVEIVDAKPKKKGNEYSQSGGRSKDGKGANTAIQAYLTYLQKKIKKKWNPPYGEKNELEVEFEIFKNGELKSIKILKASTNHSFDQTAIKAITVNEPFKRLPSDYDYPYLRVRYTFNYSIDGDLDILDEIN